MKTVRSRREFLGAAAAVAVMGSGTGLSIAQAAPSRIKAVAFDAFAIFDASNVFGLLESFFPGSGAEIGGLWRMRQFEYTWLRNSMHRYVDFRKITEDALQYAVIESKVELNRQQRSRLMSAYLQLKPWPDAVVVLRKLHQRGMRLAFLTNLTAAMLRSCVESSGLAELIEFQLSTDRVKAFKPDPAAYQMGLDAFGLCKDEIAFVAFGGWDAAGAKAFGYPTYWANRLGAPPEQLGANADVTHHDLVALESFLDRSG